MRSLALLVLFMGVAQAAPPPPGAVPVMVSGAWARATLPHQDTGVVYLTLQSPRGDVLTGADTAEAGMAMLHQSTHAGAMAGMEDVDNVPLPAGQVVRLAPGGTHIMLMSLKHALKVGSSVRVALHFARAGTQEIAVPVLPAGATGP
jgi:copper(I)-binding protein